MPLKPFIIKNTKEPTNDKQNLPITQITLKDNHKGRVKIIQIPCPILSILIQAYLLDFFIQVYNFIFII